MYIRAVFDDIDDISHLLKTIVIIQIMIIMTMVLKAKKLEYFIAVNTF